MLDDGGHVLCSAGAVNGESGKVREMCEGSLVIARWRNHSWYPAIVTGHKNGR